MQPKFKKGDWVFCEFVLQQIKETEEDRITSVTDSRFSLSSYDLSDRCFPLELKIKGISDSVKYWHDEFHQKGGNKLNYPDLNRELIKRWVEMCTDKNDDTLRTKMESLNEFGYSVLRQVDGLKYIVESGVSVFR